MKTTGNTILITGGTSGLGLGLAQRFAAAGNTVVVAGRRTALLAEIEAENPGITGLEMDVAVPASIQNGFETITASHPDLNVVITMAGIMQPEDLTTAGFLETAEATITTNLLGTIRTVAAFTEFLQGRPDAAFMTVSSGLAFVPLAMTPTYNATKAAVHSFTEILRLQLAESGVEVLELIPPAVATTLLGQDEDTSGRAMPVDEYLDEVFEILSTRPDEKQVMVERVKMLRFAEVDGAYDRVLHMLAGSH
ncbi:short-subunit dehydrogenase involved in D-alanine esterification of teichoic acids [Frondihabitans sp. PhB188]|uniref:SDR family oxidoreductase n=1 Tax=Frondihabitans sp. PhB188 TaxID=2485200 RepID=UPI000F499EC7|nr:SDR family NAD(P)-dependent oxidoreductase [Frondihabitans sp. PhB188]ROQ41229.1 short-subunit dehydrogenase involved in D-alanine esterification of teichoic acids [Frondihabitans sp. PhB188]